MSLIFCPELAEEFGQQGGTLGHGRDDHMFAFGISVNVVTSAGFRGSLLMTPGAPRM